MWTELKKAAQVGVLWGVKLLIAGAIVLSGLGWVLNDYRALRLAAQHGEVAYQTFVQIEAAQKAAQAQGGQAQQVPSRTK
jgi:hypothetical protein